MVNSDVMKLNTSQRCNRLVFFQVTELSQECGKNPPNKGLYVLQSYNSCIIIQYTRVVP